MANSKSFQIPIGNKREMEEVVFHPGFRTKEQFETVRRAVESEEFDFSCVSKLFDPEDSGSIYQGPFNFLWYDKVGGFHLTRIGKRGKILKEIIS